MESFASPDVDLEGRLADALVRVAFVDARDGSRAHARHRREAARLENLADGGRGGYGGGKMPAKKKKTMKKGGKKQLPAALKKIIEKKKKKGMK